MIDELWLIHPDEAMIAAFAARFAGLPDVRWIQSRFEDLEPHDAFVTAGNAFGIMTAGIDAAVVRRLGENVMRQVQDHILDAYWGEQPVGTAFVVRTGNPDVPFLVHAPTMRVPGNIAGTDKVYAATWAALLAIAAHNARDVADTASVGSIDARDAGCVGHAKIRVAAFPAMGTGFGGVPFDEAARQMAAAYRHFLEPPHRLDWDTVVARQRAICYDGERQVL
jgi:O-acetyl-ADP-ribose deacetylase (regulator of RNase III)